MNRASSRVARALVAAVAATLLAAPTQAAAPSGTSAASAALAAPSAPAASTLFALLADPGMYSARIDPTTGAVTRLATLPYSNADGGGTGLAVDVDKGLAYTYIYDPNYATNNIVHLLTVDTSSGNLRADLSLDYRSLTCTGSGYGLPFPYGLAFDRKSGQLTGMDTYGPACGVKSWAQTFIDPTTGALSTSGAPFYDSRINFTYRRAAFDPDKETYYTAYQGSPRMHLFHIDPGSYLDVPLNNFYQFRGLAFDTSNGQLLGMGQDLSSVWHLVRFDPIFGTSTVLNTFSLDFVCCADGQAAVDPVTHRYFTYAWDQAVTANRLAVVDTATGNTVTTGPVPTYTMVAGPALVPGLAPTLTLTKPNLTGDSFYDNTFSPKGPETLNVAVGPGINSAYLYVDGVQSLNVLAGGSFNWSPPRNPDGSLLFTDHTLQVKGTAPAGVTIWSNTLTLYALVQEDGTAISLLPDGAVPYNPFSTDPYQASCLDSRSCPGQPPTSQPSTDFRMSNDMRVEGKSNGTAFIQTRPVRQPGVGSSFICDAPPSQAAVRTNSASGPFQDGAFTSYYSTLETQVNVYAPDVFRVPVTGSSGSTNSPFTPWISSTVYVAIAPNGQAQVKWGDQAPQHPNPGNSLMPYHYLYSQGALTDASPHPVPQLLPWARTAQYTPSMIIAGLPPWLQGFILRAIAASGDPDPDKFVMEHTFAAYRAECARARFAGLNVNAPNGQQIDAYLQSHFPYSSFYVQFPSFAAALKPNVIPHYNGHEFSQGVSQAGFVRSPDCIVPGCPGLEDMKIIGIFSPLSVHVYDAAGHHSGPRPDGSIEQGIDSVTYLVDGDTKVLILPNDSRYRVQLQGAGTGVATVNVGTYDGQAELRFEQYNAIDVTPNSVGTLTVGGIGTTFAYDAAGSGTPVVLTPTTAINNPPDPSLDTTPPTTTALVQGTAGQPGYLRSAVDVRLTASDDSAGVALTEYSLDGGTTWSVYTKPIHFAAAEGRYTVSYRSTDYMRNVETSKSVSFVVDLTAPLTTATPAPGPNPAGLPGVTVHITTLTINGTNYAPITCFNTSGLNINLSAVDNLSGVAQINYTVSGAQTATGAVPGTNGTAAGAILVSSPGISTVSYGAVDLAGNQEATAKISAAVGSVSLNGGTLGAACAFTADVSSIPAHGSGTVSGTVTVVTPWGTFTRPFSAPFTY